MLVFCKFNKLITERQFHAPPEVFTVEAGVHISTKLCTEADWLSRICTFPLVPACRRLRALTAPAVVCLFAVCLTASFHWQVS